MYRFITFLWYLSFTASAGIVLAHFAMLLFNKNFGVAYGAFMYFLAGFGLAYVIYMHMLPARARHIRSKRRRIY